ncbi:MAG TPA: hypothetical protein VG937_01415 [Polyangiaceae bacterium]|nr:hypothetical protein [Polyangiaceae bacterium]
MSRPPQLAEPSEAWRTHSAFERASHVSPCLALEAPGVTVRARIPLAASTDVEGKARCQSYLRGR